MIFLCGLCALCGLAILMFPSFSSSEISPDSTEKLNLSGTEHQSTRGRERKRQDVTSKQRESFKVIVQKSLTLSLLWFSGALCSIHRVLRLNIIKSAAADQGDDFNNVTIA